MGNKRNRPVIKSIKDINTDDQALDEVHLTSSDDDIDLDFDDNKKEETSTDKITGDSKSNTGDNERDTDESLDEVVDAKNKKDAKKAAKEKAKADKEKAKQQAKEQAKAAKAKKKEKVRKPMTKKKRMEAEAKKAGRIKTKPVKKKKKKFPVFLILILLVGGLAAYKTIPKQIRYSQQHLTMADPKPSGFNTDSTEQVEEPIEQVENKVEQSNNDATKNNSEAVETEQNNNTEETENIENTDETEETVGEAPAEFEATSQDGVKSIGEQIIIPMTVNTKLEGEDSYNNHESCIWFEMNNMIYGYDEVNEYVEKHNETSNNIINLGTKDEFYNMNKNNELVMYDVSLKIPSNFPTQDTKTFKTFISSSMNIEIAGTDEVGALKTEKYKYSLPVFNDISDDTSNLVAGKVYHIRWIAAMPKSLSSEAYMIRISYKDSLDNDCKYVFKGINIHGIESDNIEVSN